MLPVRCEFNLPIFGVFNFMSDILTDLSIAQTEASYLAIEERRQSRFGRLSTFKGWHMSEAYLSLTVHAREAGVSPKSLLRKARKTLHREHQQAKLATLEPKIVRGYQMHRRINPST